MTSDITASVADRFGAVVAECEVCATTTIIFNMVKALFTVFFLLVSGCATYTDVYVPPATSPGATCVASCGEQRQSCQMQQQSENVMNQAVGQQCQANYTRSLQTYQVCTIQYPPGRCTQWTERTSRDSTGRETNQRICSAQTYVSPCVAPKPCSTPRADTSVCESNFKTCYKACGGRIDRIELK